MSTRDQIREAGNAAFTQTEKVLNTASKATAEVVGEKVNKTARSTQEHTLDFVGSVRNAIQAGTRQLREDGYATAANLIDNASGGVDYAEGKVEGVNPANISNSVQQFIREKPLIAFGGLALAGFLAAAAMQKAHEDLDQ